MKNPLPIDLEALKWSFILKAAFIAIAIMLIAAKVARAEMEKVEKLHSQARPYSHGYTPTSEYE